MKNIKDLYDYLENLQMLDLDGIRNIEKQFKSLENNYKQKKLKNICRWEMLIWGFGFDEGKLIPQMTWATKEGKTTEYPSIKNHFDQEVLKYVKERSKNVINPFLKIRYNQILWQSNIKHRDNAISIIENCKLIINENKFNSKNDSLLRLCKCLILSTNSSKYEIEKNYSFIENLLESEKIELWKINNLGSFCFEKIKSKNINSLLNEIREKMIFLIEKSSQDDFWFPDICNTAINIGNRLSINNRFLYLKKAEHYVRIIDNKVSTHKQHFYFKAIQAYSEIGEKEKADELYVLIEESKNEIRMGSFKEEFSGKEIQSIFKAIEYRTDRISDWNSKEIYNYLATNDEVLPKAESFYEKREPSFLDSISSTSFDVNKNFTEGEESDSLNSYHLHLMNFSNRELFSIFQKSIKKNNMCYNSLVTHLRDKSWIGKVYSEDDYDGNKIEYSLLATLAPSLFDFFNLFESQIKMKDYNNTNYILCTDSLTLKLEGLIRYFAKLIKCPTIVINKRKNGTRERYIEEIISQTKFKEYFNEEDLIFINYLLTNKGMNIRNKIAHGFYRYEHYSASLMILLITLLLRISKFDFKREN